MSNVVPFDTLAVALALRDEAGLDQKQAEGFARVLSRMLVADLVTKTDLTETKAALKADIRETEAKLESKIRETEAKLESKIRESEYRLEAKIEAVKADLIKWLFGTIVAQTDLIIAAVKLLH